MTFNTLTKGKWWLRWVCRRFGHDWEPTNHPRLFECAWCDALGTKAIVYDAMG